MATKMERAQALVSEAREYRECSKQIETQRAELGRDQVRVFDRMHNQGLTARSAEYKALSKEYNQLIKKSKSLGRESARCMREVKKLLNKLKAMR